MQQRITALTKLERYAIVLVAFVFLFGVASDIVATSHLCSLDDGSWKANNFSCDIRYTDTGGAGLQTCEYKVTTSISDTGWLSAGSCSGSGPVDLSIAITVGSGTNCDVSSASGCNLHYKATDNANNLEQDLLQVFNIDFEAPQTTIIPDGNAPNWSNSNISFSLDCIGETGESGCNNTGYKDIDSSLSCTTSALVIVTSWPINDSIDCTDGSVCQREVCYQSTDGAGNIETLQTSSVFQVDKKNPEIVDFDVNPKKSDGLWVNIDNPDVTIDWHVKDVVPNSGLQEVQVWRSDDGGSTWSQIPDSPFAAPSNDWDCPGCVTDSPSDGTYLYGIHVKDNADNEITESDAGFSSIEVQVDKTPPNTTITDAPPDPSFSNSASFAFTSTESGGFNCELDGGGFLSCTSPQNYTVSEGLHTFRVRATDIAGNTDPTPASWDWTVVVEEPPPPAENQAPSISSVSDTPDPIAADSTLTFSVNWSDPDAGDVTRIHICKTNSISGQTCPGSSWCDSASFSSSSPTSCNYTTQASDAGTNSYYAFVCDDENACSSSQPGSFLVDATAPSISSFTRTPVPLSWVSNASPNAVVSWSVLDTGGANLKQIEVWRAWDADGDGLLQSGEWDDTPIFTKSSGFDTPSTDIDSYTDTTLAMSGTYWYGLHVLDNADNLTTESTPLRVQVDKDDPTALVDAPTFSWLRSSAQQQSFLKTTDEDLDSGINPSGCTFEVCSYEPDETEHCKGTESRACNITSDTEEIFVGPGATHCDFQGRNACDIFVDAIDNAGNTGGSFRSYNVDWEFPVVGKLYTTATEGEQIYPIQVGQMSGVTYRVHVTDNLEINFCNLFIDNVLEQGPVLPSGGCINDCVIEFEDVSLPAPGGDNTYHNNYAVCFDSSSLAGQGEAVDIVVALSVDLSAIPSQGSSNTQFKLRAEVSGTMTGLINYKFDCENDGVWELEVNNETQETYTTEKLCQYASTGLHTAKVFVERGGGNTQDTVDIPVVPNTKPEAINLKDNNSTADYCFVSAPPIILSWEFSDPDPGDVQTAYQVQIGNNDTGKVASGNTEYAPTGLSYNTTYSWRVKVWDLLDDSSSWANGTPFTTPVHAYPQPGFTWIPLFPSPGDPIQFQDETVFAPGSFNQSWLWSFGDGTTSSQQNPAHTYEENGAYVVALSSSDDSGLCGVQWDVDGDGIPNEEDPDIDGDGIPNEEDPDIDGDGIPNEEDSSPSGQSGSGGAGGSGESIINITLPLPEWQEISPF